MAQLGDVDLLSRLVAFPSVSSQSNRPIAEFIADYLDQAAISVQLLDSGDLDKANLIAQVGPPVGEHRGGLVLSGHMDVVPAEESGWQSDPFVLSLRDGRYYGRGSADMKGFLALATQLLREAATAKLRRPLWLIFTRDEEVGTLGAQDLAQSWPSERLIPRNAIIGEPSSMRVVRMHKGHFTFDLEVRGKSAHSAYPHLGDNAIESAAKAVAALRDLRLELAEERCASSEFFGDVPYAPLNLGRIQGGAAVNIVADRCAIQLGARPLPGMDTEQLQRRVQRCIGSALAGHDYSLVAGSESPSTVAGAAGAGLPGAQRVHRTAGYGGRVICNRCGLVAAIGPRLCDLGPRGDRSCAQAQRIHAAGRVCAGAAGAGPDGPAFLLPRCA